LFIVFEFELSSRFKAKSIAAFNSLNLGRNGTCAEGFGNALLTVRAVLKIDFHEKGMLVAAINAMNVDFVCRHGALFIANLA
jgi:hypothetical protein